MTHLLFIYTRSEWEEELAFQQITGRCNLLQWTLYFITLNLCCESFTVKAKINILCSKLFCLCSKIIEGQAGILIVVSFIITLIFLMTYQYMNNCCGLICNQDCIHSSMSPEYSHIRACSSGSWHTRLCLHLQECHEGTGRKKKKSYCQVCSFFKCYYRKIKWEGSVIFLSVAHRHSCPHSYSSREDTGTWRSLWCCSRSVQAHNCVCLLHIHLCLQ